jgi:hypothetical protein
MVIYPSSIVTPVIQILKVKIKWQYVVNVSSGPLLKLKRIWETVLATKSLVILQVMLARLTVFNLGIK